MSSTSSDPLDLGPPGLVLGLSVFRPGAWNGDPTSASDLCDLVANYQRFSQGDQPFYLPFVSINHDNGLSFGRVTAARMEGELLVLDLDGVPLVVRQWMVSDRLTSPSIEFWDPNRFIGPDGKPVPTIVLKCCTLLGNDAPAVKGLPPLSAAKYPGLTTAEPSIAPSGLTSTAFEKYRDTCGVSKFSDQQPATRPGDRTVNPARQRMVDALKAAGFPTDLITDAVPDALLEGFVSHIQKCAQPQNPNADANATVAGSGNMAPANPPMPASAQAAAGVQTRSDMGANDDDGVQMYRDLNGNSHTIRVPRSLTGMAQAFATAMDQLRVSNQANLEAQRQAALNVRQGIVKTFRDKMTKPNGQGMARMTPAQFAGIEPLLMACDHTAVRKFADGSRDGSELDERMAAIEKTFVEGIRRFNDTMPAAPDQTAQPAFVALPGMPAKASEISPRTRAILEQMPEGQAGLAALK